MKVSTENCGDRLRNVHSGLVDVCAQSRPVIRNPNDLHVHPALRELGYLDILDELAEAERAGPTIANPVFISHRRMILAGFGRWQSARLHGERQIQCVEFTLADEDALQFILLDNKPRRAWNTFVRVRLALTLESHFRQKALANMRDGGCHKGLARLPTPEQVHVRSEIAKIAGVGTRNVGNVKLILKEAHPHLIHALSAGTLTINKARKLCKLPKSQQLDSFAKSLEDHEVDAVIRRTLTRKCLSNPLPDTTFLLAALQEQESHRPGSVSVRCTKSGGFAILVGKELVECISPTKS